jgi:hypothetical protein
MTFISLNLVERLLHVILKNEVSLTPGQRYYFVIQLK